MKNQPEALRLADLLITPYTECNAKAAAELRRLHAENQALNNALQYSMGFHREIGELAVRQRARLDEMEVKLKAAVRITPQAKQDQLTNEQIDAIADAMPGGLEGF